MLPDAVLAKEEPVPENTTPRIKTRFPHAWRYFIKPERVILKSRTGSCLCQFAKPNPWYGQLMTVRRQSRIATDYWLKNTVTTP